MEDSLTLKRDNYVAISIRNVLLQDLIADKILKDPVLSFDDLKQCRLVCTKWKNVTEKHFRKRSTIVFRFNEYDIYDSCSLSTLLNGILSLEPTEQHPFDSFRFENYIPFHPPIFEDFLLTQGSAIKELVFDNVQLLMSPYSFSPLIGSNVTKLVLSGRSGIPLLDIHFEALVSIQYLSLSNCRIFVKDKPLKIRPKELLIENVHFERKRGQELIRHAVINDFFIFDEHIKKIVLRLSLSHLEYLLNVNCTVDLDVLDLQGITLVNWDTQKWTNVKKLILTSSSISSSNIQQFLHLSMKSKEISWLMNADLLHLPDSVEKLVLSKCDIMNQNLILPKLTYLSIAGVALIKHFRNCSSLVELHLVKPTRGDVTQIEFPNGFVRRTPRRVLLNVNDIPKTVKRMSVENVDISGEGIHNLETLIVSHYQWDDIDTLLTKLKPDNLVVFGFIKFGVERVSQLLKRNFKQLVVGEFCWTVGYGLKNSSLSSCTDKESKYYLFANGRGNPISEKQFEKFKTLE